MLLNLLLMLFFFLDEKVLMLPVVYEKYNNLLSMNINAEIYKFSFTENNFSKCVHFFPVIGTNKIIFLTSILNIINQYLVILPTENIFIPFCNLIYLVKF